MLHLLHTLEVRLQVRKADAVIITPEMADLIWCLSSSQSLSIGFFMDVARFVPRGAQYHADIIYLLS